MANRIHPTSVIGPQVELGDDNVVGPFCVIQGPVTIGDGNFFASHVNIGGAAEVHGHLYVPSWEEESEEGGVVIGSHNIFKEFVTLNTGWQSKTRIGDRGMFMGKMHFGHDAEIGDRVTISCAALIGGHTIVSDDATIGLGAALHQRLFVGAGSMTGMQAAVTKDVPPFVVTVGAPAKARRLNTYRLDKMGVPPDQHATLADIVLGEARDTSVLRDDLRGPVDAWLGHIESATH